MQAEIERFFASDVTAFTDTLSELAGQIEPSEEPRRGERFTRLNEAILRSMKECSRLETTIVGDPVLLKDVQQRYREEIAEWFDQSWFMHRAKTKPRGYPGDHEILTGIYDRKPKSLGIGGFLDLYFLNTTLARAVRGRLLAAKMFLIQEVGRRRGDVSILNVACGPCREFFDGFLHRPECQIRITCVDSDQQALEYVQAHVMSIQVDLPIMECACYNALRMSAAKHNIRKFGRRDIIYSVGLFDYIPDGYLISLLRGLRESLNRDGVLYVAFKDADRYDKTEYHWLVDWYFFQRSEADCRDLCRQAGFDEDALEMTRDETGVIMNFIGRIGQPAEIRVDAADEQKKPEPARTTARPEIAAAEQLRRE
jgi:hypothetical protein